MVRRIIGIILIITGLLGVGLSIAGVILGQQIVTGMGTGLSDTLSTTITNLGTVKATLSQARGTVKNINQSLQTTRQTILDSSLAISQTQPLLDKANQIASQKVPAGLDAIQATLPNIGAAATAVEDTLSYLSEFKVDKRILGIKVDFDLKLDYKPPEPPLAQSVGQVETNLAELAGSLRQLESDLRTSRENIGLISQDLAALGGDMDQLNQGVATFDPILADYLGLIADLERSLTQLRANLNSQLATARLAVILVMVWIGLANLTPLYLGWNLWQRQPLERPALAGEITPEPAYQQE